MNEVCSSLSSLCGDSARSDGPKVCAVRGSGKLGGEHSPASPATRAKWTGETKEGFEVYFSVGAEQIKQGEASASPHF